MFLYTFTHLTTAIQMTCKPVQENSFMVQNKSPPKASDETYSHGVARWGRRGWGVVGWWVVVEEWHRDKDRSNTKRQTVITCHNTPCWRLRESCQSVNHCLGSSGLSQICDGSRPGRTSFTHLPPLHRSGQTLMHNKYKDAVTMTAILYLCWQLIKTSCT